MDELNGCTPRKVSVTGPYTFKIGDTSDYSEYNTGGVFTQVKIPKILDFVRMTFSSGLNDLIYLNTRNLCASR